MSILAMSGRVSGGVKGRVAEEQEAARAFGSGTYGKYPAYCHIFVECYHSERWLFVAFCRECWSFSGIRGFLFIQRKENDAYE